MRSVFLADVDDTLVSENTTVGFVRHVLEAAGEHRAAAQVQALGRRRGVAGLGMAALHRLTGLDLARPALLRRLRGRRRHELTAAADGYVDGLVERAGVPAALEHLERARADGADVVLVSSTLEPVADALARRFGAAYRSSTLAWDGERCAGRLADDLTGRKLEAVAPLLSDYDHVTVMTDNRTDRDLVARADRRLVVARRPSDRSYWADLDPEFVAGVR